MEAWKRWDRRISRVTEVLVFAIGTVFSTLVLLQVVARFLFDFSVFLINALTGFLFIWFLLLGAGLAVKKGMHVAFELLIAKLALRLKQPMEILAHILTFGFFGLILWASLEAVPLSLGTVVPSLGVSMFWAIVAIPIGFVLMIYHQANSILYRYFDSAGASSGETEPPELPSAGSI